MGPLYEEEPAGALTQQPAWANGALAQQFARQRAANPRKDVTDFMGYGPDWQSYVANLQSNLQAQLPQLTDTPEVMAQKGAGMYGNFAPLGITAFHGSPHKFDKFDMSKVGTGEGAQAYGHGLYFAENPKVALDYQKNLAGDYLLRGDGTVFDPSTLQHLNVRSLLNRTGDLDSAIAKAQEMVRNGSAVKEATSDLNALQQIKDSGGLSKNSGHLYKVDLPDEHIAKMLDWDKPLSQQPELLAKLQKAGFFTGSKKFNDWEGLIGPGGVYINPSDSAQRVYIAAQQALGADKASELFKNAGIPGIRYLDQGSRTGGAGTSNFVVFDDKIPKILGRE